MDIYEKNNSPLNLISKCLKQPPLNTHSNFISSPYLKEVRITNFAPYVYYVKDTKIKTESYIKFLKKRDRFVYMYILHYQLREELEWI